MLTHLPNIPQLATGRTGILTKQTLNILNLFEILLLIYHLGVPLMQVSEVSSQFSFNLNVSFLLLFLNNSLGEYTILAHFQHLKDIIPLTFGFYWCWWEIHCHFNCSFVSDLSFLFGCFYDLFLWVLQFLYYVSLCISFSLPCFGYVVILFFFF